jgi:hypothetical protein
MKTFVSFFHRKAIMPQQNTSNDEDKIIRNIFLTIRKQLFEVYNACLLRIQVSWVVAPCGWAISSQSVEDTYCLHSKGYESMHRFKTLKVKVTGSFEMSGGNYTTTWRNNPEDLLPPYENRFAKNKIFQCCVDKVATFPLH